MTAVQWNIFHRFCVMVLPKPSFNMPNTWEMQILHFLLLPSHLSLLPPLIIYASCFLLPPFPSQLHWLPPSLPQSLCIWSAGCRKMPQSFRHPLVTDRNIWLRGRHTGRKIAEKIWPLECCTDILPLFFLLVHSFNASLSGLPIADTRELLSICLKSPCVHLFFSLPHSFHPPFIHFFLYL